MSKARAPLLVGLVTVLGVAAFVAMYSMTRGGFVASGGTYRVYALFDDVAGLEPRTRVTLAGVRVGEVVQVGLDEEHPDLARVTLVLEKSVELREGLPQGDGSYAHGATITRASSSVLGDSYLELTRGARGAGRKLEEGDRIPTAVSVSGLSRLVQQLSTTARSFDSVPEILKKIDAIASDVKAISSAARTTFGGDQGVRRLESITTNIDKAAKELAGLTRDVRGTAGDVQRFLQKSLLGRGKQVGLILDNVERFSANASVVSADAMRGVRGILADVRDVTRSIRGLVTSSRGDVEGSLSGIKGAVATFTKAVEKLDDTLASLKSITGKIDGGKGAIGRLVNNDKVVRDLEEVVGDAGDLVKRVTRLQTGVELSTDYLFNRNALKTTVRLKLQPRPDKFYLFELVDDPRGKTSVERRVTLTNDPALPPVLTEDVSRTTRDFRFSLQFAKRWYFLTGRLGIIEGTGGIGLDMEFFNDALKIQTDLFDVTQDVSPRVRLQLRYTFLDHFFVTAGVDDVANPDRFDWFLGLGLRFVDDDLKALLTVAPTPKL